MHHSLYFEGRLFPGRTDPDRTEGSVKVVVREWRKDEAADGAHPEGERRTVPAKFGKVKFAKRRRINIALFLF